MSITRKYNKHGMTRWPEYYIWKAMKYRCQNPNIKNYPNYGGRGIRVCESWRNSFVCFIGDMGRRPSSSHSIERLDNNGNYEPGNCKWATVAEQNANKRQKLLTLNGKTQKVPVWADELGVDRRKIYWRLAKGWSVERTLAV